MYFVLKQPFRIDRSCFIMLTSSKIKSGSALLFRKAVKCKGLGKFFLFVRKIQEIFLILQSFLLEPELHSSQCQAIIAFFLT